METLAKRRALGRGLGALIPGAFAPKAEEASGPMMVALTSIEPNPEQPRQHFDAAALEELADSIRQHGLLQPLLVRRMPSGYQLIAGERRFRAAQAVGLTDVPVVVREAAAAEVLEMALVENIQREDLNPIEEARGYRRLIEEFQLTQEEAASRVGKERSTVANTLRLLQLPREIQAEIESGALSAGHARALVSLSSETAKLDLARKMVAERLTVRQAEQLVKEHVRATGDARGDADVRAAEQRLTEALGTRVRLQLRRDGSGSIRIEYHSLEALNGFISRFCGG